MDEGELRVDPELQQDLWKVPVPIDLLEDTRLSATELRFYLRLMGYARQRTTCFPSRATLAKKLGVGVRSIDIWKKKLKELGLLDWVKEIKSDGREHNIYTLLKYKPIRSTEEAGYFRMRNETTCDRGTTLLRNNTNINNTKIKNTKIITSKEVGETKNKEVDKELDDSRPSSAFEGGRRPPRRTLRVVQELLQNPSISSPVEAEIIKQYKVLYPDIVVRQSDIRALGFYTEKDLEMLNICLPELPKWNHHAWMAGSKHLAHLLSISDHFVEYVINNNLESTPKIKEYWNRKTFEEILDEELPEYA
jgi:hypothetical protein